MKVLIACEESQIVCKEFREKGHEAYSCDIQNCSGNFPQWHIKDNVFNIINDSWDIMIAFPPCTHLAVSGAAWFEKKKKDGRQKEGIDFFLKLANSNINKICLENPVGIMSNIYKKPDQIIQPYYFGDSFSKKTCLWLKNLPKLYHNKNINLFDNKITHVDKGEFFYWIDKKGKNKKQPLWYYQAFINNKKERSLIRSKTFPGIAKAMAIQWG